MIEIVSENNIRNGKIISKQEVEELIILDCTNIYEVIRVIDKKPVFLKEHFDRLCRSIELSNIEETLNFELFSRYIKLLIEKNKFVNCNIRVSFIFDNETQLIMYFVKSLYPPKDYYDNGINTIIIRKQRNNPNVKFYEKGFRDKIDEKLVDKKAYEAILVNEDDIVSEGSKSNVFFVEGESIITSLDKDVLLGVTRSKVLQLCEENKIKVIKRKILLSEIKDFDAAFITGTSNNVLPIKYIDSIEYNSSTNKRVKQISELYLNEMKKNIQINP